MGRYALRAVWDFDEYIQANAWFHDLLARFADSPILRREIERMSLLPLASPSAFLSEQSAIPDFQDSLTYAQRQHRAILDAITNREGARAEALTREHARLALSKFHLPHRTATDARQAGAGAGIGGLRITGTETKK